LSSILLYKIMNIKLTKV